MESSLSLRKADLEKEVGIFLGWGGNPDNWDDDQLDRIRSCVTSGISKFYWPIPVDGIPYDWSFMHPVVSLEFPEGESRIRLPDDFGGLDNDVTVLSTDAGYWPLDVRSEPQIRRQYSLTPDISGRPQYCAINWLKPTTEDRGQRCELVVYPMADQDYTLQLPYFFLPNALTDDHPYYYGGAQHRETVKESCLAVAERLMDDQNDGPHAIEFGRQLAASMARDRTCKAQTLGRNRDRSDETTWADPRYWRYGNPRVTYNGD